MGTPRVQGLNFRVSVSPYLSSSKGSPDVSFYAGVRRPGMQVTPEDFPQWCVAPTWCGLCCPLLAVLAPTRTSAVPVPANPSREPTVNGEERPNAEVRHRAWISAEPTQCSVIRLSGSPPRADGARRRSTRGSDRRSRKVRRIPRCQTGSRALAAGGRLPGQALRQETGEYSSSPKHVSIASTARAAAGSFSIGNACRRFRSSSASSVRRTR